MLKTTDQKMLEEHLSKEQRKTFKAHGHFYVVTQEGQVFLLHDGQSCVWMYGNPPGQRTFYCVYARDEAGRICHAYTSMLTQLLFLRSKNWNSLIGSACHEGRGYYGSAGLSLCPPMKGDLAAPGVPRGV
jgi:hypothetical protein